MSDFEKVKIFNPSNPTQLLEIYRYRDSRGNAKRGEIVPNLAQPERCPVRILDYYLEKRLVEKLLEPKVSLPCLIFYGALDLVVK